MKLSGKALVLAMCIGQVGNLLPHVVVPAIMAQHLMQPWDLSATEAGLMASAFAFGYMLAVPVLATLTDRIDARGVLLVGSLASGLATAAFGLFAQGLLSASLIWGLAGIGFAGAYMPGLKAMTDRLGSGDISRSITLYTSSYSLGVGLSFLLEQVIADAWGWRMAFILTALGPLAMIATCLLMAPVQPAPAKGRLLDLRPVLRNRPVIGYVLGYAVHCFEVYGMRTWLVAFWGFVAARHGGMTPISAVMLSFFIGIMAMPASLIGNELAIRIGRHRAITLVMIASGTVALLIGLFADASPWLLLALLAIYSFTIPGDSGALTSGMTASAAPEFRGVTMALYSTIGFAFSGLGAWAVGVAIDMGGGTGNPRGWLAGFALMSAVVLLGPLALWWSRRQTA